MVLCSGCGRGVKRKKALSRSYGGKALFFCCRGCDELYQRKRGIYFPKVYSLASSV